MTLTHAAHGRNRSYPQVEAATGVQIWLKDITRDFTAMNAAYGESIDPANKPVRATVQSRLATPHMLVEIQVTAAMP